MTRPNALLAALLGLALAAPGLAQQAPAPAETPAPGAGPAEAAPPAPGIADELSLGRVDGEGDGVGASYIAAVHGDWEQRCVRTADGADPCQLYQLLKDTDGNPVAEFSIFNLPAGGPAVAGATAIVPLETLLTQDLALQIDAGPVKKYPFSWCSPIGCIARIGLTEEEVAAMRRGNLGKVTIVPVVAPDQLVTVPMSLRGFTAGMTAVAAANATAQN
ncbi:MAG TPA: invasion associated locus B family protein [Paracoccaceae bacterium]|nr:invasion associated locus B family protein [Paracoccaceae bacterium]